MAGFGRLCSDRIIGSALLNWLALATRKHVPRGSVVLVEMKQGNVVWPEFHAAFAERVATKATSLKPSGFIVREMALLDSAVGFYAFERVFCGG